VSVPRPDGDGSARTPESDRTSSPSGDHGTPSSPAASMNTSWPGAPDRHTARGSLMIRVGPSIRHRQGKRSTVTRRTVNPGIGPSGSARSRPRTKRAGTRIAALGPKQQWPSWAERNPPSGSSAW